MRILEQQLDGVNLNELRSEIDSLKVGQENLANLIERLDASLRQYYSQRFVILARENGVIHPKDAVAI